MTIGNDGTGDLRSADGIGAVTDSIAKVDVVAQAGGISGTTSQVGGFSQHVGNAELLEDGQPLLPLVGASRRAQWHGQSCDQVGLLGENTEIHTPQSGRSVWARAMAAKAPTRVME